MNGSGSVIPARSNGLCMCRGPRSGAHWQRAAELLETFNRARPAVEVTVLESHGGTVVRDLRDGRLDAVIAPSMFGSADLRSIELGQEPWVVLVGQGHRLAGADPLPARDLHKETVIVTGHRDGAGYDKAVVQALSDLGVTPALQRGGPGPALLAAVADGKAVALTTAAGGLSGGLMIRRLDPIRTLPFELIWRAETPSPALSELIAMSHRMTERSRPRPVPFLMAVA